jgi:acetoin utilization protein AcuB
MIAEELIHNDIVPLRTSDTGEEALGIMADFYVRHLPIVNNTQLLGLISEDDLLDHDPETPVGAMDLSLPRPYVKQSDHFYEVFRLLTLHQLSVIPVVDNEDTYIGLITLDDILQYFARIGGFSEPGSIIVLETSRRGYSLSEISRIVESENASVLNSFVASSLDGSTLEVTIKVNVQNDNAILATFERFGYEVKGSFKEESYDDILKERYDAFMNYLNV